MRWTMVARRAALLVALAACNRERAAGDPFTLPVRLGDFTGGPLAREAAALRRTYDRGPTRITVTLARFPMGDQGWASWVKTSRESFPQAALDAPADRANGFYQCGPRERPACDLLIQLRSGVHVEIRGGGTSTRADVDAIAGRLPLRALAGP